MNAPPPLTLIQLVSEQTVQNLLPVLRLRPQRLIHLVTPRTAMRSAMLRAAATAAGLDPTLETIRLSAMPGIPESFHAVGTVIDRVHAEGDTVVVNFTGGTKLMSIGAYVAARHAKVPSLYVDTQDACFMDGDTSADINRLLGGDWSFTPLRSQLGVDLLGLANGVPRITAGRPWHPIHPLAEHLFHNPPDEEATHAAFHGPAGLLPAGREPRNPAGWLELLDQPVPLPATVAGLAADCGLVRAAPAAGSVLLPNATRDDLAHLASHRVADFHARYYRAVAPLQHATSFLTGGWWEVIVCAAAHRSGMFHDLRWSAHAGAHDGPDTEEDVLGVDGVELLYINCKRGGPKARLLPLLDEIRARAATIGGHFNRRFLAILHPPRGKSGADVEQRARDFGIRLLTRSSIVHPGAFQR